MLGPLATDLEAADRPPTGPQREVFALYRQKAQTGETWKIMVQMKLELRKDLQAPEIMVAPWCGNSIFGLTTYTENRSDGKVMQNPDGACKDPVDCVKYFTLEDVRWAETRTDGKASSIVWGGYGRARAA